MNNQFDVIRRPVITEKSAGLKDTHNSVCFEVHRDATKPEIKNAVEKLFGVKVADVRVVNMHGKVKRQGRFVGRRADWKKAYVVLKKGEKMIEFFEQA
jgi:large subunit ribosomal protein L23